MEWQREFKQMFRIGGSVALNMCLIAKGAAEGYMYGRMRNRVKSWDIAAAALLVQNAGGRVLDRRGQPLIHTSPRGSYCAVTRPWNCTRCCLTRHCPQRSLEPRADVFTPPNWRGNQPCAALRNCRWVSPGIRDSGDTIRVKFCCSSPDSAVRLPESEWLPD